MNNQLELYHQILFLDLRPWLTSSESDIKFKQLLIDLKKEYFIYQPFFELDFTKPFSNIRKYYFAVIENEAVKYLNELHAEMAISSGHSEKGYLVHIAQTRTLFQLFQYTISIIKERAYSPLQFENKAGLSEPVRLIADESYILHCLKHQLVRVYMEIQENYKEYMKEDELLEDEIYLKFYNEAAPIPSKFIAADKIIISKNQLISHHDEPVKSLTAIRGDIRNPTKGIPAYDQIIKNQSRFAQIEEELFRNGYINEEYQFIDCHGKKQYLAAIYHQLIRKGYFNNRFFPENIVIKPLTIRKFLDHRYSANLDKQFRNWANNQAELHIFIESDYWLDHIPQS